ncbi:MAG: MarR family transcriptional regulator [Alphaproteobacteria bacterium]|nr:MarR family transcriptional regulator [Alphaproteobacteria bacterium]MDE1985953.1 MarR family transcriptional regulator [Alphaproteobacteria bacterium]MDE2163366.1 MarR family transcriptional regulator [Alphaproteobacteria bacterium]MDE2267286.1 MarR family transcriptional regulator [Alphaproteobacteria bacterium]MDE2500571.1 MarR family transcriptional regulator [Alphaproteobacteria bacterium]
MNDAAPRDFAEVLRDEWIMKDRIAAALIDGPKTIPEIAEALGAPSREVTQWVMAMRRFGKLEEMPKPKADDYFQYKLTEGQKDGVAR